MASSEANQETGAGTKTVLTIGHSNHSITTFLELLSGAGITAIADVRSAPFSRRFPQFNRPELKMALRSAGIEYVFVGDQLGARPKQRSVYLEGRADYQLIAAERNFREGIERVVEGAEKYRVALMCAEREPLDCHRTILVGRRLKERGLRVLHVLGDGTIEPNEVTENRLLKLTKLEIEDLFEHQNGDKDLLSEAYDRRGRKIAYVDDRTSARETAGNS